MSSQYPRFRITIELLDVAADEYEQDKKLAVYMRDQNRIAGDVWLNKATSRHSFDIASGEFIVSVGRDAWNIRSVQELVELERSRK